MVLLVLSSVYAYQLANAFSSPPTKHFLFSIFFEFFVFYSCVSFYTMDTNGDVHKSKKNNQTKYCSCANPLT